MILRYVDPANIKEVEELVNGIYNTRDDNIIQFMELYHTLYNLRLELIGLKSILLKEDVWPRINFANTALKKYYYENDREPYKSVEEYITGEFSDAVKTQGKEFKNEFKELVENKLINESLSQKILMDLRNQITSTSLPNFKNINYNDLIYSINSNVIYEYFINYVKSLVEEKRQEKKNFRLGTTLAIVGIIVSIALTLFTLK